MTISKYFNWFFDLLNGIVSLLNKICFQVGNIKVSYFSFIIAFFVLHIIIAAFIKSGGARND